LRCFIDDSYCGCVTQRAGGFPRRPRLAARAGRALVENGVSPSPRDRWRGPFCLPLMGPISTRGAAKRATVEGMGTERVSDHKVVGIAFVLRDDDGEAIDGCDADDPLYYLHGAGNVVAGLEQALEGCSEGDAITAVIPPEQGYGPRQGPGPQPLPRDAFPPEIELELGLPFDVEDEDGEEMELFVVGIEEETVYVDVNHPLAGMTLHFEVEVLSIRDATEDEREHGHPHHVDPAELN